MLCGECCLLCVCLFVVWYDRRCSLRVVRWLLIVAVFLFAWCALCFGRCLLFVVRCLWFVVCCLVVVDCVMLGV